MNFKTISTVLLLFALMTTSGLAAVVINEVELDPYGENALQWIELYNTGNDEVEIGSWSIVPLSNRSAELFIEITSIPARGFYVLNLEENLMDLSEETLILKDENGNVLDRTPVLYDSSDSECSWGRSPDGSNTWIIQISSEGGPSTGEPCGEEKSHKMNFDMDHRIEGSGFVKIRNIMHNRAEEYVQTREFGSGSYRSEDISQFNADLYQNSSAFAIDMKSSLSARHSNTSFQVTPRRSINYSSKWSESSSAQGDKDSPALSESHSDADRLDSEVSIRYENYELGANLSSDFDGISRIDSDLANFKASEEYAGSFTILNRYHENISNEVRLSVSGEGFVSTDKNVSGRAYSNERGTGNYRLDEVIQASDISSLNISRMSIPGKSAVYLAKDVSLLHSPANHSYARVAPEPMSISWREGTGANLKDKAFMTSDFSDVNDLESETIIFSLEEMKTSAKFSGRARLKAGFVNSSDPDQGFVFTEDDHAGNFSISRGYRVYPKYSSPHMSIRSQGQIDPQDCSRLRYTITLTNDGNRPLWPIFVKTSFPSGTSFLEASIDPFELTARYANWSVSYLSVGESFNINLDLKIGTIKEDYSSSTKAITIYEVKRGNASSDRRLTASNSSRLHVNWSDCPQIMSATYSAVADSENPRIINYRVMVENLAEEDMIANITVNLPAGMRFVSSALPYQQINEDSFIWTLDRLKAGKRRSISFTAKAEEDGFYVSNASVIAVSREEGREMASSKVIAAAMVGKVVYTLTPTAWQDWCPCDENLLGKLSWNETSLKSGQDLGCVC